MTNRIHPTAVIGDDVELGVDNVVGPYAVLLGPCRIGDRNWIGPHACVGAPGEHRGYAQPAAWAGELGGSGVVIGDENHLREHTTVHQGTERPTAVGDGCFIMAHSHVGHDVHLQTGVTLAAGALLAGHCTVGAHATIGMGATLHQRTTIGPGAMVGMSAAVRGDVAPFLTVIGNPARVVGVNQVALRKLGCDDECTAALVGVLGRPGSPLPEGIIVPSKLSELLDQWPASAA